MARRTCSEILATSEYGSKHRVCPQPIFEGDKCYYHGRVVPRRQRDAAMREKADQRRHPPPSERRRSRRMA